MGEPAALYRSSADHSSGPAAGRAGTNRGRPLGAGGKHAGRPPTGIHLDVVASGGLAEPSSGAQSSNAKGTEERRFVINDAGTATVRGVAASDVSWQFTAIPDKPPTIALAKEPEGQARGALQLS